MWLLPLLHLLSALAARTYYRLTVVGPAVPRTGAVLLVANHPNALLDPVVVAAAARRPVRLLAKAPLFDDWRLGWLVRAAGAIPVHRRTDDPSGSADRNLEAFDTVVEALSHDAVVGIFPEGRSHNEPALARLKSGAARMALGTWARHGTRVAIVPIGLVFRDKALFRSRALAVVGEPIAWTDLAAPPEDRAAVACLTSRIEAGLRAVTVNMAAWSDQPVIECAEAIWAAERTAAPDPRERIARLDVAAVVLARVRRCPDETSRQLLDDLVRHCSELRRLGLAPRSLTTSVSGSTAVAWAIRRWYLVLAPTVFLAATAVFLFVVPYRVTAAVAVAFTTEEDERSTYKLLGGIVTYGLWVMTGAGLVGWWFGWRASIVWLVLAPAIGRGGLWALERLHGARADLRRFMTLRGQRDRIERLRTTQRDLAERLVHVYEASIVDDGS